MNKENIKIAVPVVGGKISEHFGHSEKFEVFIISNGTLTSKEDHIPPDHEPGVIPKWLHGLGANVIITGGIGQKAVQIFNSFNIEVLSGAPSISADEAVKKYLSGELKCSGGTCSH